MSAGEYIDSPEEEERDGQPLCMKCFLPTSSESAKCGSCGATIGQVVENTPYSDLKAQAEFYDRVATHSGQQERGMARRAISFGATILLIPFTALGWCIARVLGGGRGKGG